MLDPFSSVLDEAYDLLVSSHVRLVVASLGLLQERLSKNRLGSQLDGHVAPDCQRLVARIHFLLFLTEEPIPYLNTSSAVTPAFYRYYTAGKWMSRNATWSERLSVMYCQALPNGTDVSNSLLELLGLSFYLYQTESLWCHIQSGHEMRVRKSKHLALGSELPYAWGCISGCLSHLF